MDKILIFRDINNQMYRKSFIEMWKENMIELDKRYNNRTSVDDNRNNKLTKLFETWEFSLKESKIEDETLFETYKENITDNCNPIIYDESLISREFHKWIDESIEYYTNLVKNSKPISLEDINKWRRNKEEDLQQRLFFTNPKEYQQLKEKYHVIKWDNKNKEHIGYNLSKELYDWLESYPNQYSQSLSDEEIEEILTRVKEEYGDICDIEFSFSYKRLSDSISIFIINL